MPENERKLRMNYLQTRERTNNVDHWMRSYFKSIMDPKSSMQLDTKNLKQPVMLEDFDSFLLKYTYICLF